MGSEMVRSFVGSAWTMKRRRLWRVTESLALPTIGLGVALGVAPDRAELEVHVWLLIVLGLALLASVSAVALPSPSPSG